MKRTLRISLFFVLLTFLSRNSSFSQLSGTFNVPANYPSIAAAINDLNVQGISGAVLITVNAGHTETASPGGYTLTTSGTAINTIVFQKTGVGANPLIVAYSGGTRSPATASQDGIWHFVGCDYITVDGIDLLDMNAGNPASMEYGYGFFKANGGDGCQNNSIINCNITLNRINNVAGAGPATDGSRGINMVNSLIGSQTTALTVTSSAGSNSFNHFYGNTIQNCNIGIALIGYTAPSPFALADTDNDVGGNSTSTGNNILNYGGGGGLSPAAGIRTLAQYNLNVSFNTINNNSGSGINHSTTLRGIYLNLAQSANVSVLNNTLSIKGDGAGTQVSVIENLSGATAASNSVVIENNLITNCTNSNNTSGTFYGIFNNAASASYLSLSNNSFSNNILSSANGNLFLLYNNAAVANSIRFNGNLLSANTFSSSTSGGCYLLHNNAVSSASLEASGNTYSNNQRYASTGATYLLYNAQATSAGITFNNNVVSGNTFSTNSGVCYGIYNNGTSLGKIDLSHNTYSVNTLSSASGAVFSIYNTGATSGNTEMSNNVFSSENNSITANGSYYGVYNNAASASSIDISNNQFEDLQFSTFTGSVHLIYNRGPASTTFALNTINYNSVVSSTFNTSSNSPFLGIYNGGLNSGSLSISHNSLMNITWSSATSSKYLIINNGIVASQFEMNDNLISACSNTNNTTGLFYGLYNTGLVQGDLSIGNNQINTISSTANTGASALIYNSASVAGVRSFTSNVLANCQFSASASGDFNGIYNSGNDGSRVELSANTFSNISVLRFSGASYLIQNTGPAASSIGTVNILNNLVTGYTGSFYSNGAFFALYNNAVSAQQLNISTNTVLSSANTSSNGVSHLFYNRGALTNTFNTISFVNNSVSNYSFNSVGNGSFFGLYNNGVSAGNVNISTNTLTGILCSTSLSPRYMVLNSGVSSGSIQLNANQCSNVTSSLNTTGVFYFVNNTGTSGLGTELLNNSFSNAQLNGTVGDIYFVHNSGNSTASVLLKDNAIQNVTTQHSAAGVLYGLYNNAASCTSLAIAGNTITNCNRSSFNGASYWIYNRGTATTVINACNLNSNSLTNLNNSALSTGPYYAIYSSGGIIDALAVLSNTIGSITWSSTNANRYLIVNSSLINTTADIKQNVLSGFTSTLNTTAGFYGIYNDVSFPSTQLEISFNVLENLNLGSNSGVSQLISSTGTLSGIAIESNVIRNYTVNTSGSGNIYGIFNACRSVSLTSIRENTLSNALVTNSNGAVYDILNTAASSNSIQIEQNQIMDHSSSVFGAGAKFIIYNEAASAGWLGISSNSISNIQHSMVNGAVHFIYNRGTLTNIFNNVSLSDNFIQSCTITASTPLSNQNYIIYNNGVTSHSVSVSSNSVSNFNWQTLGSGRFIIYNTCTSSLGISIQNNVIQSHNAALNTSGDFYGIYNNSPNSNALNIEQNRIDQINSLSTTGRCFLIYNTGALSNSVSISSNSLTNNSQLSSGNASFFGINNTALTSNAQLINGNVIASNSLATSNGSMAMLFNTGVATSTVNNIEIKNNIISANTCSASANAPFYCIRNNAIFSNSLSIVSNRIFNQQSLLTTSNRFMIYNTGGVDNRLAINQNTLSGLSFTANTSGSFYGINNSAACNGTLEVNYNELDQLNISSSTGTNYAIFNSGAIAVSRTFNGNKISNLSSNTSASGTYYGIFNQSSSSQFLSMSSNTLSNQSANSYSVPIYLIYNTGTPATTVNSIQMDSNEIIGGVQKTGTLTALYAVFNNSVSAQNVSLSNNIFTSHTLEVQGSPYLVYNTSPTSGSLVLNGNQFISNLYTDSLSPAFYGVRNEGEFSGALQMGNNSFSNTTISTKTASLYLLSNAVPGNSGAGSAELNGNMFVTNTFSIGLNSPLYFVSETGDTISGLAMNNNTISANSFDIPSGSVYGLHNSSAVTNTLEMNTNLVAANTNSSSASGDLYALFNSAAHSQSTSLSSNTVVNNQSHHVSGNTNLIYNSGLATSAININNNVLNHVFSNPGQAYSGIFNGIWASQSGSTALLSINGNVFSSISFSLISGLGPLYFIRNTGDPAQFHVSNNSWNNLVLRNSAAHYFIHNTGNVQTQLSVYSNTLSTYTRQQASSGDLYFYFANSTNVPAACVQSFSSNLLSNINSSVTGVGAFYGIFSVDGGLGTYPLKQIHHNEINTVNYNSNGDFVGYYANYLGDGGTAQSSVINSNTLSNVSWEGNIFGIYHGIHSSPNQAVLIHSNEINNLLSNGIFSSVYPACLNFSSKEIRFYKNKIHSIQANGASAIAHGIYVGNSNTTEISNNRVGRVYAPNSTLQNPVNGIFIAGGSTVNLNYNTVFLNATSAASNFNSNALYASTNPQLSLRNNIFINVSTATGSGINAAYRRSSASLGNHALNSDRNVYYAGPGSASNYIYYDPSNNISALFNYQALLSPRENNSQKENTGFLSLLGNANGFLMVDPAFPSATESGAQNITGISDDFDSQIRQGNAGYAGTGSAPDIGSDEYNQALPPCSSVSSGSISPASATICAGQNITFNSSGSTYTSAGGILHQWQSSSSASGPFTTVVGGSAANKTEYTSGALSSGTLYFVMSSTCANNSQTSVSNQVTLVVLPSPSVFISASSSTLCSGNGVQLNLSTDIGTGFNWTGPSNYTSSIQSPSLSNLSTFSGGVYSVQVTAANSCTNATSYSLQVYPSVPAFTYTPSSPGICFGDSVLVSASVPVSSPTLVFNPQATQNSANAYPAPYTMYYGGQKMQFVIQASELFGSGFVAGSPITSIEFPVVALGSAWGSNVQHCQDFQISVGHTNLSSITSFQAGMNVVLPAYNFTPVPGSNTHLFATPFIWDGQSNLIVETIFSNNIFGGAVTSVIQYNSPTGNQSTVVFRADNQSFANIAAATASNVNVGNARPDFRLNGVSLGNYIWAPSMGLAVTNSQSTQVSPASNQIYTTVLSNGYCSETNTLLVQVSQQPTLSIISSATVLCVGNVATLAVSGANSYTWNNGSNNSQISVSPVGNATYVVVGSNQPCPSASAAVQVSVVPAMLISAVSSSPVICSGETVTLSANGASSYTWSNGANTSTALASPIVNTTYTVYGSNGPGCFAQQLLTVISNSLPVLQVNPPSAAVCAGEGVEFVASGAMSYTWLPVNLSSAVLFLIPQNSTTYTLLGQAANQCKNSLLLQVQVDPCVGLNAQAEQVKNTLVYPNPSSGQFILDFVSEENKTIRVYGAEGGLILEEWSNLRRIEIDLESQAKGFYLLKIQVGSKEENFKLLVQ